MNVNKLAVVLSGLSLSAWIGISLTQISFTDIAGMGAGSINGRVADLIANEENKEFSFSSQYSSTTNKCKVSDLFDVSVDKAEVDEIRKFWKRVGVSSMDLNVHRTLREDVYQNIRNCIDDIELTKNEYEKIVSDGDWYKLESEYVSGTVDYDAVLASLNQCEYTCDLTEYINVSDNSEVESQYEMLEKWKDWKVEYDQTDLVFGFEDIKNFITYDGGVRLNLDDLSYFTDKLATAYDTAGKEHSFKTSDGKKLKVNGGTYGWEVDKEKETEWLRESIKKCKSEIRRKPEFLRVAESDKYGADDIGDTYVEISIEDQHVWIYKKGEVVAESDCVTGRKNRNDTPKGVYYCYEIKPGGKWLTGDTYRTWVNKWVRLTNTGIGLHDAAWRRSFGGDIYKKDGSHGCINLPTNFSKELIKEVYFGMPVVIY